MWAVARHISCAGADTLDSRSWNADREVVPLAVEIWRHSPERQVTLLEYSIVYGLKKKDEVRRAGDEELVTVR